MKVFIVMQEEKGGYNQTIKGVFLSKESAEKELGIRENIWPDELGVYMWIEDHEVEE
jgi:hypothetical protein